MAHKFHQTQKTYMLAKAAYETANARYEELVAPHFYLVDDEDPRFDMDAYDVIADAALETTGLTTFRQLLVQAEECLINWAHEKVSKNKAYIAQRALFQELYDAIKKPQNFRFRQTVIDLSARLK